MERKIEQNKERIILQQDFTDFLLLEENKNVDRFIVERLIDVAISVCIRHNDTFETIIKILIEEFPNIDRNIIASRALDLWEQRHHK